MVYVLMWYPNMNSEPEVQPSIEGIFSSSAAASNHITDCNYNEWFFENGMFDIQEWEVNE